MSYEAAVCVIVLTTGTVALARVLGEGGRPPGDGRGTADAVARGERALRHQLRLTEALIDAGADRSGRMAELLSEGRRAADDLARIARRLSR